MTILFHMLSDHAQGALVLVISCTEQHDHHLRAIKGVRDIRKMLQRLSNLNRKRTLGRENTGPNNSMAAFPPSQQRPQHDRCGSAPKSRGRIQSMAQFP
jgi:hypothetical protein